MNKEINFNSLIFKVQILPLQTDSNRVLINEEIHFL